MVFKGFFCSKIPFLCTFWPNLTKLKFEFWRPFGGQKWSFLRFYMCFSTFFFQIFFLLQKRQKMIEKRFSRLYLHPKIIFMQFWTIYDNSKILNFLKIFGSKMHFFSLLRGLFGNFQIFFFKMRFWTKMAQKCSKMLVLGFSRSQTLSLCNFGPYWRKLNFDFFVTFLTKILQIIKE